MTKDVIEGSRDKSYTEQQALVAKFTNQLGINYEVPHLFDATICIFMHYVSFGERLFNTDGKWTFTHCQGNLQGYQDVVGGFSPEGLSIGHYHRISIGLTVMRKLF